MGPQPHTYGAVPQFLGPLRARATGAISAWGPPNYALKGSRGVPPHPLRARPTVYAPALQGYYGPGGPPHYRPGGLPWLSPTPPTGPPYRLRARATGRGRIAGGPTPDIWAANRRLQAGDTP
eukprot:gene25614-biopygen4510